VGRGARDLRRSGAGLAFLRSRAIVAAGPSEELVASADVSEAADRGRRWSGSGHTSLSQRA
jgi:hypothetical protein